MIPYKQRHDLPVNGTAVKFQGGTVKFYTTTWSEPWWVFWKPRRQSRIFRVHPTRDYIDRYNWYFFYERHEVRGGPSRWAKWLYAEPSTDRQIERWMSGHYWTFMFKGFPLAKKWLKKIDQTEYHKQRQGFKTMEYREQGIKQHWQLNFKTLKVTPYPNRKPKRKRK